MPNEQEIIEQRQAIRQQLIDQKIPPYPQDGHKTHTNTQALAAGEGEMVTVAGRIKAMRGHGKIRFFDLEDETGKLQVVLQFDVVKNIEFADKFDVGDFMRATGKRYVTKAGQQSVLVETFDMLTKAIRQMPDSWSDLKDEETRYRKRTIDLAMHKEVRDVFYKRSIITQSVRDTLIKTGFLEVETPVMQPLYGGANARPFTTHINAWDLDLYLRISDELYLKRLIMGGIDKVFEIGHNFRNEGVDRTHNPEFTMMECYAAYWDYNDMMNITEEIYRDAAKAATGSMQVEYQGTIIDFEPKWRRLTMKDGIKEYLKIDVDALSDDELRKAIKEHGGEYKGEWIRGLGIAELFGAVEKNLIQPTFVIDLPRETTSLCKPHRSDPTLIERFEPYIFGIEIGNAYTELNDPILQRQFWEEERAGDPESHPLDENFIEAMEYGMPPTGGLGLGIDRMVMLLTNQTKLRDVILFPLMKPTKDV